MFYVLVFECIVGVNTEGILNIIILEIMEEDSDYILDKSATDENEGKLI